MEQIKFGPNHFFFSLLICIIYAYFFMKPEELSIEFKAFEVYRFTVYYNYKLITMV